MRLGKNGYRAGEKRSPFLPKRGTPLHGMVSTPARIGAHPPTKTIGVSCHAGGHMPFAPTFTLR
jgi:hypothetical protein